MFIDIVNVIIGELGIIFCREVYILMSMNQRYNSECYFETLDNVTNINYSMQILFPVLNV